MEYNLYKDSFFDFFGGDFFATEVDSFFRRREAISTKNLYSPEIPILEYKLHPLIKDLLGVFRPGQRQYDIKLVPKACKIDLEVTLLGRDLLILKEELEADPEVLAEYKRELKDPKLFRARRYELMVAASYKLEGFAIQFIKRTPQGGKTHEFTAISPAGKIVYVECKQRNQVIPDSEYLNYLALLTSAVAPALIPQSAKLIIDIELSDTKHSSLPNVKEQIIQNIPVSHFPHRVEIERGIIIYRKYDKALLEKTVLFGMDHPEPSYTRTDDAYIACHKGLYIMIKRKLGEEIIKSYYRLLADAKKKLGKEGGVSLLYFDIGDLPADQVGAIARAIKAKPLAGIDGVFLMKSLLHMVDNGNGKDVIFSPETKAYLINSKLRTGVIPNTVLGLQGDSGLDNYIKVLSDPIRS